MHSVSRNNGPFNAIDGRPSNLLLPEWFACHGFGGACLNDLRNAAKNNAVYAVFTCQPYRAPYLIDGRMSPIMEKQILLIATKDINVDDEITVSYGSQYWKDYDRLYRRSLAKPPPSRNL
jgi:hypothetical protein